MLPNRGETYRGPDGLVQIEAVDGAVEGVILVKPVGAGSTVEPTRVTLAEFRDGYTFAPQGAAADKEVAEAARRGFEGREGPVRTMTHNPAKVEER